MPALVVLATADAALADAWERQLAPGRKALRIATHAFPTNTVPGFAAVVILDAAAEALLPTTLARCPTIYVGEPRSLPFEQARMTDRAKVYLSYEESATRLREFLPLVEELAEKQSIVELLADKVRGVAPLRAEVRPVAVADAAEIWDFLEAAVENLDSRDRLITEFRRASRHVLRASHAVFFLREADAFRADRGTSSFPLCDPMVAYFEEHPTVIDGAVWESPADPRTELAVRNHLAMWGARLLVPVHDNGRLLGLISFGVRDDGRPYDDADRMRAIFFARLLRHFLAKSAQFGRLSAVAEHASDGAKYLPRTLVLSPDEGAPREAPLVVRDLIGRVRRERQLCRVAPAEGQPFRATAGLIPETGGIWAFWEEASAEVHDAASRHRAGRRELLREIALTLSHEVSNALVSLAILRQLDASKLPPAALLETARADVARLEALNHNLSLMQTLHEIDPVSCDVRELAQKAGGSLGIRVEVGPEPIMLLLAKDLLDYALRSLVASMGENQTAESLRNMTLQVRSAGRGPELTALLSLKGKELELEGILPEPADGSAPTHGRLGVFLAKEILRLHRGEIHAGPGMEGAEILISFRSL